MSAERSLERPLKDGTRVVSSRPETQDGSGGEVTGAGSLALDTAEYIADLSRELARMARTSRLDLLASILEIARLEAHTTAKRLASEPGRA